jgi:rod shape-determining protein MreC
VRGSGYFGYLSWQGGDPSVAYVEDIPRHAKLRRGDWLETSGFSSIFPHGVTVGRIAQAFNSADGLSYKLKIRLSTDFSCVRDVFVISDHSNLEQLRLQEAARDSMRLGIRG